MGKVTYENFAEFWLADILLVDLSAGSLGMAPGEDSHKGRRIPVSCWGIWQLNFVALPFEKCLSSEEQRLGPIQQDCWFPGSGCYTMFDQRDFGCHPELQ